MFGLTPSTRAVAARRPTTRRSLSVGLLDDRSLPSVSATFVDGTLFVQGSQTGPAADHIRVVGDPADLFRQPDTAGRPMDLVRVYDGEREVGVFTGVRNIEVQAGGNSTTSVELNGYDDVDSVIIGVADGGTNSIRLASGVVGAVKIASGDGAESVEVTGMTANTMDIDTGAGVDRVRVDQSMITVLNLYNVEAVDLSNTDIGSLNDTNGKNDK